MDTMIRTICDVPNRSFAAAGQRLGESWPSWPKLPGLETVLAHTPLSVVSAAQWRWREGHHIPTRSLPTSNFALYLAGSGTVWLEGQPNPIRSGTLLITPRGWSQRVVHDPGHPYQALSLHAQMSVFGGERDLIDTLGLPRRIDLRTGQDEVLLLAMRSLAQLSAQRPPLWRSAADAWLTSMVMHLLQHYGDAAHNQHLPTDRDIARLAPALAHIDACLVDGSIAVCELAAIVGLSEIATRRLFLRLTGLSPNRYIQSRRIARACQLLRDGQSMTAVAAAVGCSDASVFHRLFRRHTGITPGRWLTEEH
ncbi:MAG: AraC family transcriptional regulator [Planctomycetota bacterium]|nr:MAG: AraC family transcriptional regulator [Planctomycetota bacterium]